MGLRVAMETVARKVARKQFVHHLGPIRSEGMNARHVGRVTR
jgi:hypothetical protein